MGVIDNMELLDIQKNIGELTTSQIKIAKNLEKVNKDYKVILDSIDESNMHLYKDSIQILNNRIQRMNKHTEEMHRRVTELAEESNNLLKGKQEKYISLMEIIKSYAIISNIEFEEDILPMLDYLKHELGI